MKPACLMAALLVCSSQLKWDNLNLSSDLRGKWNSKEKYWTGALHECGNQCTDKAGVVCGKNQKQCCKSSNSCTTRFGMEVCREVLTDFNCNVQEGGQERLRKALPPTAFPELQFLYN